VCRSAPIVGIAAFGTVFVSLRQWPAANPLPRGDASAGAMSTTGYWLVLVAVIGVLAATALARTGRRSVPAHLPAFTLFAESASID